MAVLVGNLYADKARAQGRRLQHLLHGRQPRGHGRPARGHAQQRRLPQLQPLVLDRGGRHGLRPDHLPGRRAQAPAHRQPAGDARRRPEERRRRPARRRAPVPAVDKREERQRIATLVILFLIVIFFWVAFYQNFFGLTLFAERSTDRPEMAAARDLPVLRALLHPRPDARCSWPSSAGCNRARQGAVDAGQDLPRHAHHEPGHARHGLRLAGRRQPGRATSCRRPGSIGTYFVVTLAEILISPMGQSFVSKVAPPRIAGLMMGGWFAATAAGSYGSGLLGKSYSRLRPPPVLPAARRRCWPWPAVLVAGLPEEAQALRHLIHGGRA